jgi:hypothetical protein
MGVIIPKLRVDIDKIRKVARRRGFTDIQAEILAQLYYLNPLWIREYGVDGIVGTEGGYGIRLHIRNHKIVNIDIIYDEANDLYNVEAHQVIFKEGRDMRKSTVEVKEIAKYEGIFFEDLDAIIKQILNKVFE